MSKAIVIGAGIGGLASAIRLACKGYEVDVYEANEYAGGKLTEINRGAYRFDAGPSLFTMPELLEELIDLCDSSVNFPYKRLDEICRYFFEDGVSLNAYASPKKFATEAALKTGVDEQSILKHLKKSSFIYQATAHLFLGKSLHKISSYLSLRTLRSMLKLPFLNIFKNMDKVNRQVLKNEKMVQLFNRYATYNGSDPYRAPGILNIIPHLEFNKGAFFPKGGMQSITNLLLTLAKEQNVRIHYNQKVEEILVREKKVIGVLVNDSEKNADVVVSNMDIVPTYRHLLKNEKAPEKILSQERSSSALIFYWGIKKTFTDLILHNIFFSENYREEFRHLFEKESIYKDPTIYINISSKENAGDAPKDCENWFVMINVPGNKEQDWDTLIQEARSNILKKLSRMLGEDVESLIEIEEVLDPRSIESKTASFQGSLYGTASNTRMAAFFRHPNFSRKIKGLYFCGGSVHPGGGIPLALSSAQIVDQLTETA